MAAEYFTPDLSIYMPITVSMTFSNKIINAAIFIVLVLNESSFSPVYRIDYHTTFNELLTFWLVLLLLFRLLYTAKTRHCHNKNNCSGIIQSHHRHRSRWNMIDERKKAERERGSHVNKLLSMGWWSHLLTCELGWWFLIQCLLHYRAEKKTISI